MQTNKRIKIDKEEEDNNDTLLYIKALCEIDYFRYLQARDRLLMRKLQVLYYAEESRIILGPTIEQRQEFDPTLTQRYDFTQQVGQVDALGKYAWLYGKRYRCIPFQTLHHFFGYQHALFVPDLDDIYIALRETFIEDAISPIYFTIQPTPDLYNQDYSGIRYRLRIGKGTLFIES